MFRFFIPTFIQVTMQSIVQNYFVNLGSGLHSSPRYFLLFTVGMPITRHPPYRSQRALLMHWAPASSIDAHTFQWIRMTDKRAMQPPLGYPAHSWNGSSLRLTYLKLISFLGNHKWRALPRSKKAPAVIPTFWGEGSSLCLTYVKSVSVPVNMK